MSADVSVIILTRNEEIHLERCLRSIEPFAKAIYVVDSFSTDRTRAIAEALGAHFIQHEWTNHALQLNWAIDHCPIATGWTLRIDADEYVTPELADEIRRRLPELPPDVTGVAFKRRVYFMGRWIRHGSYYPTILLRMWRTGKGRCEERWMDEHMLLREGRSVTFECDFVDDNLRNLTAWTEKHNGYATREAIELLNLKYRLFEAPRDPLQGQARGKRWLKESIYSRLPPGARALAYFVYRYILRLGFLDGRVGLIFHTLQGFWHRFLVDAKIQDIERIARDTGRDVRTVVREDYDLEI